MVYATHNGISQAELCDLIPDMTDTFWSLLCYILQEYLVLTSVAGLLVLANDQVNVTFHHYLFLI